MNTPSELATKLVASLDLDDYFDIATGQVVLKNPRTGEPTTSIIEIASPEHPARKKIDMARTRKLRTAFNQTGKLPVNDPMEDIEEQTDLLVASTLGWNLMRGGAQLHHSAEAARNLYTDPTKQWVRNQVLEAINKTELFIGSSAKT